MKISHHTYRDGRAQILNNSLTYLRWAQSEPERAADFVARRKTCQRQLAQLREAEVVIIH